MIREPDLARLRVQDVEREAAIRRLGRGDSLAPEPPRGAWLRRPAARVMRFAARAAFWVATVLDPAGHVERGEARRPAPLR
jgi:hypothetical protein